MIINETIKKNAMKTLTYLSPVPRLDKLTKTYVKDLITIYNVEMSNDFGVPCYVGTTTPKGKKLAWCCPSKVIELKTI
jgi:hypothetical protein